MNNQTQKGEAIYVVAPSGGFTAGNGYQIGSIFGVAANTVLINVIGVLYLEGIYTLTKKSAEAWAVGDLLYWDSTNHWVTKTAPTGAIKIGAAMAVAANPTSTGSVRLNGAF